MYITADNYEIHFDPENPETLHIFDTTTEKVTEFTLEEAFSLLSLMLKHKEELHILRTGE